MKTTRHVNVLVAGAGPAGSACAIALARAGMSVLLCDKEQFPRDKICGDCINPRSWQFFKSVGIADALLSQDLHRIDLVRVTNLNGRQVTVPVRRNEQRPFFSIKRSVLDNLLLRRACQDGVNVLQQTQVIDAVFSGRWLVTVRSTSGIDTWSSDFLIGADGRNSTVANKIGSWVKTSSGTTAQRRIGIQWHADVQPRVGSEVQLYTMSEGYFGIVNVNDQTSNIAMVTSPETARDALADFPRFIERTFYDNPIINHYVGQIEPRRGVLTTYPVNPVRRYWEHPAAYLVGDARQTLEPFTGEGVSFALEDGLHTAQLVSDKLQLKMHSVPRRRGSFLVNRVVSPALRNRELVESLLAIGSMILWLPRLLAKTILHTSV